MGASLNSGAFSYLCERKVSVMYIKQFYKSRESARKALAAYHIH
jgi:hypothetical protein